MNTPTPTPTPRTDAATYPADCLGATLVTNRDLSRALETELAAATAERDQLRFENSNLRAGQKACEACDEPTAFEMQQLRGALTAERDQLRADRTYNHECINRLATATRTLGEKSEKVVGVAISTIDHLRAENERLRRAYVRPDDIRTQLESVTARAERAEAELAAERARLADLVADLNDACITLESAENDCDDYAMQNTAFKLMAVRNVLLQHVPNAAMKEGA